MGDRMARYAHEFLIEITDYGSQIQFTQRVSCNPEAEPSCTQNIRDMKVNHFAIC